MYLVESDTEVRRGTLCGSDPVDPTTLFPLSLEGWRQGWHWSHICDVRTARGRVLISLPRNLMLRATPNGSGSTKFFDKMTESSLTSHPAVWRHS